MRTVFLDRDGVINQKAAPGEYVTRPKDLILLPKVSRAIKALNSTGWRVVVVTNQRGVALGRMSLQDVTRVHDQLMELLRVAGAALDAIYVCPHEIGSCHCRKPDVGLFLQAERDFGPIHFESAYIVGDSATDIAAGKRLGATTILLTDQLATIEGSSARPEYVAGSLYEAVITHILPTRAPSNSPSGWLLGR